MWGTWGGLELLTQEVKIEIGALISTFSSYLMLRKSHRREVDKETRESTNKKQKKAS